MEDTCQSIEKPTQTYFMACMRAKKLGSKITDELYRFYEDFDLT